MNKTFFICLLLAHVLIGNCLMGQTDISVDLQVYPTGIIPTIAIDTKIANQSMAHIRAGLNIFDHRDLGVQEEEEGSGFGFSVGYKYFLKDSFLGWYGGIKSDVWWNSVDWMTGTETGETDIVVIQPTAQVGYLFQFSEWIIAPSIAFGFEWNVSTDGQPTGEGAIGLVGLQIGYRL